MIARWLTINVTVVFLIVLWSMLQKNESSTILVAKIAAQGAFILFLTNLNMYFVFTFIRKSKQREVKIKLAKIAKRLMKFHIPIAFTATLFSIFHGVIMVDVNWFHLKLAKPISGIFTIFLLSIVLFSGFLRRRKATGRRRKFHYLTAFTFFGLLLLHIFL